MSNNPKRSESLLKLLLVVLIVAVGAQSYLVYRLVSDREKPDTYTDNTVTSAQTNVRCPINTTLPGSNPNPYVLQRQLTPQPPQRQTNQPRTVQPSGRSTQPKLNSMMSALQNAPLNQQALQLNPPPAAQLPRGNSLNQPGVNINMFGSPRGLGRDPFEELERMQQMMDQMMGGFGHRGSMLSGPSPRSSFRSGFGRGFGGFSSSGPSIRSDQNNYVIQLKIPGLDKSDIKTEVRNGMLTISGVQKSTVDNSNGNNLIARSQSYSQFQNSFSLPGPVDSEKMKVDYSNNTLTITIPKA